MLFLFLLITITYFTHWSYAILFLILYNIFMFLRIRRFILSTEFEDITYLNAEDIKKLAKRLTKTKGFYYYVLISFFTKHFTNLDIRDDASRYSKSKYKGSSSSYESTTAFYANQQKSLLLLNIPNNVKLTKRLVNKYYKIEAKIYHPDKAQDPSTKIKHEAIFKELNEAKNILLKGL